MWSINNKGYVSFDEVKPILQSVSVSPTYKCDCRCTFCHTWGNNGWAYNSPDVMKELDVDVLKKILIEANQNEHRLKCVISGGESLIYSQFDSLVTFLKQNNIGSTVITSGNSLKKKAEVVFNNVEELIISLSGPPELNDLIRGRKNHFDTVCDGIEKLLKLKKDNNSTYPNILINLVLTKDTQNFLHQYIDCIKERFKFLGTKVYFDFNNYGMTESAKKQLQIDDRKRLINGIALVFGPLLYTSEEQGKKYTNFMKKHFDIEVTDTWKGFLIDKEGIDTDLLTKTFHQLWDEAGIDYSNFVDFHNYFKNLSNTFGHVYCYNPWRYLRIRPDGSVNFCPDLPDYSLGNIYTDNLQDIWYGEKAKEFRNVLKNGLTPMCNRCDGIIFGI